MPDNKDKNPKKASDTGTKDKNPRTVSETDTLRKRAKIVKEAPTGPEWEKITSDGEEIYIKKGKGSEPDSTSRRIEKKPIDIDKVKAKYVGPPPKDKPKKDIQKRKTPPTKIEEDEVVRVVKDEEEPNIPTTPTPTPTPQQTGMYGSVRTYRKIVPEASTKDYEAYEYPDATGNYTNKAVRKYAVGIDVIDPSKSYDAKGNFKPFFTGEKLPDPQLQQIKTAGFDDVVDDRGPNYKGSLMLPGTKATRMTSGGGGEFNQRNIANVPSALKGAATEYIEQKYDSKGKPIFTPNQDVQLNEENVTPLMEDDMKGIKTYDIPQNKAKGGKIMAPKMKKYANGTGPDGLTDQQRNEKYGIINSGVVQVPGSQNQNDTGNVPLTKEQIDAKKKKNDALMSQLGSAAMTLGSQLNQQPIDYSASERQRRNADVISVAADQALSAAVPYYGLAKGASNILGSMTAKDKYGEAKPGVNAAINEITAMPTERIASEAAKGNALGVLREASLVGKLGRTGMQIIGKGDETKGFFGGVNKALGTTDRKKAGEEYMAEQLAEAKAKDAAYKQQQAVANRDANVLEGAQVQGLYDLSNPEYDENRQLILKPGYAKGGVIGAAKMRYAKGGTIVGKGGPKEDAILTKSNKDGIEPGSFIVPAENNEKAKGIRGALFGDKNKVAKFKKGGEMESNVAVSNGEHLFTPKERKKIINYLGEEILEELAPNAEENNESENDKAMGGMIKRADGSYSKRGLWDNIRDAAGSGKKPNAEMLKQEKKIKSGYYNGGIMPEGIASQKRTEEIQDTYASGGYVVQRSSDREGKTHKVTGPDGTVKYFGDPNLGQHPSDPERKKAFYARHAENLKNNPHFRAYARETWAEGGTTGNMTDRENMREYKDGGLTKSKAKIMLHEGMVHGKPITEQQRKYFGWVAGGSKQSKMDGGDIRGYAMGTDVEGVDGEPQSNKTYAELITPPKSFGGSKESWKAAVDKSIKEGKTIPKGGVATASTTKSIAAPSVKKGTPKSKDMTPETMERKNVALQELRKMDEAQALKLQQAGEKSIMAKPIIGANVTTPSSPSAPRKGLADYVSRIDPGAAFSAYQIMQGSKLLKSGQRPEDFSKIDPAWNAAVERAQREAAFGYTPEEKAALEQQRLNALSEARFSGKNLAGGSAGTAYSQERQAINQGWANALQLKSADQQLRMQKQQYADQAVRERANFLDMQRRRAFGDAMDTYNVNQESGSALVGAGVRNAIEAFRFQKELDAQERAAKMAGAPIKTD